MPFISKKNISIFLAILFHLSGFIGIVFTSNKDWFVNNTVLNLCLMAFLLIINNESKNKWFYFYIIICIIVGIVVEVIGVNTSLLFGNYSYGNVLGIKLLNVPLLIGIQWFVTIYCCGIITYNLQNWVENRVLKTTGELPTFKQYNFIQLLSLVIDGALLATFFDYILEPTAQKLGYWQWQNGEIPFYNYLCWFLISALLLYLLRLFPFKKSNQFAPHLFVIQILFFIALYLFL